MTTDELSVPPANPPSPTQSKSLPNLNSNSKSPPADPRYVAQLAATAMVRILAFGFHFTPATIVSWWNDVVGMIEVVLTSSEIDPYVVFGALALLQRYADGTEKPVETLDTYRLFISSLMVASKILRPRKLVSWTCVLGDSFVAESVNWMEREFLITVSWDTWMMEIVEEVWGAYESAVTGRKGSPGPSSQLGSRASPLSWISSASSSRTGDSDSGDASFNPSGLFPAPLVLTSLKRGPSGVASIKERDRSTSALWEGFMADRNGVEGCPDMVLKDCVTLDAEAEVEAPAVSPTFSMTKGKPVRKLRTRVSSIFKMK